MTRIFLSLIVLSLVPLTGPAQDVVAGGDVVEEKIQPLRTPTWSSSRFFYVKGGQSVFNARVAKKAEDILKDVESLVGRAAPRFADTPLFIQLDDSGDEGSLIETHQQYSDYTLHQRLIYPLGQRNLEEDMLEEIVWLILNRYALIEQGESRRRLNDTKIPEWISVGVAQQLFSKSRQRNRAIVRDYYSQPAVYLPREIIEWVRIPDKNSRVRAACDLFVSKLLDEDQDFLLKSLGVFGREGRLNWATMTTGLLDPDLRREVVLWDLWLAEEAVGKKTPRAFIREDVQRIDELISLKSSSIMLFIPDGLSGSLTFPILLERSGEGWAGEVLSRIKVELFSISIGRTGNLQNWVEGMQSLLSEILATFPEDRLKNSGPWSKEWMALERSRQEIMQTWLSVDQYLDQVESEYNPR